MSTAGEVDALRSRQPGLVAGRDDRGAVTVDHRHRAEFEQCAQPTEQLGHRIDVGECRGGGRERRCLRARRLGLERLAAETAHDHGNERTDGEEGEQPDGVGEPGDPQRSERLREPRIADDEARDRCDDGRPSAADQCDDDHQQQECREHTGQSLLLTQRRDPCREHDGSGDGEQPREHPSTHGELMTAERLGRAAPHVVVTWVGGVGDHVDVEVGCVADQSVDDRSVEQLVEASTSRGAEHELGCVLGAGEGNELTRSVVADHFVVAPTQVDQQLAVRSDGIVAVTVAEPVGLTDVDAEQLGT